MLKVWSRLSLLLLLLLLSASRPTSIGSDFSSGGSRSLRAEQAPPLPARLPPAQDPSAPTEAASTLELDGAPDDVVDPELALPLRLRMAPSCALQKQRAKAGVGARRAVLEAPFKPPNR